MKSTGTRTHYCELWKRESRGRSKNADASGRGTCGCCRCGREDAIAGTAAAAADAVQVPLLGLRRAKGKRVERTHLR
jgi:hypothetical protein